MNDVLIAPSILSADFSKLGEEVADIDREGADWVHLDVMDGRFVPNITFGPGVVRAVRPMSAKTFDCHLMVQDPERYVGAFADAGADLITVHAEATTHLDRTLQLIKSLGKRAGVALNPATPPEAVAYVLDKLDLVLVMTVNPGFGGQKFLPAMTEKLRRLRAMTSGSGVRLEVDGGINPETAKLATDAGADVLVAGSAVFGQHDRAAAIRDLRPSVSV